LLAEVLALLRECNLLCKLEQLDEGATLAHYRQQRDDREETQIVFAHARQIIEADPADLQRLKELVRDAVEEPGLRRAWDWVSNLLCGLTGQQKLIWQSERDWPNPSPSLMSEAKGSPESSVRHQTEEQTLATACGQQTADILAHLEPAARKAYFAFVYAESKAGKQVGDREAYNLLNEEGIPDDAGSRGELADYRLPAFETWVRQLRTARRALGEQKYNRRAGRPTGKSIVKGHEIEHQQREDE
jgi:hypothetical protein